MQSDYDTAAAFVNNIHRWYHNVNQNISKQSSSVKGIGNVLNFCYFFDFPRCYHSGNIKSWLKMLNICMFLQIQQKLFVSTFFFRKCNCLLQWCGNAFSSLVFTSTKQYTYHLLRLCQFHRNGCDSWHL